MFNPVLAVLNTKIRNKLIFMCIIVIVPVLAAATYLIIGMAGILRENAVEEAYGETKVLAQSVKDRIFSASSAADILYNEPELSVIFNNNFQTHTEYLDYYTNNNIAKRYLNANPQFSDITFYVDETAFPNGFVYGGGFRKADNSVKSQNWYKEAVSSKTEKWRLVYSETNNERYLSYVRALYNYRDVPYAVMVVALNPERFSSIVTNSEMSVVVSVDNAKTVYSNIDGYTVGMSVTVSTEMFKSGAENTVDLSEEEYRLSRRGFTIVSFFDYQNTGNLFQVFLVKPYTFISDSAGRVTVMFFWYILLCTILSILLTILFSSFFSRRINFLKDEMRSVADGDFHLEKELRGTDEIFDLYSDLKQMVDSMQDLIHEAYEARLLSENLKLAQVEAEFKTLASQINPHFLYNTLETIRMKAYAYGDKETASLVKRLGKYMRRCLEIKDGLVTLQSELEFTSGYLEIQKARFGDRVSYSVYCEVEKNYKILPLIIQPIVENAFIHGVESLKSGGHIDIKVYYKTDKVLIDVIDNGQGMTDDKLALLKGKLEINDTTSGKSIGLTNVNKRIKMYHGESYGLDVKSVKGEGTRIRLTLPRIVAERMSAFEQLTFES